LEIQPEDLEDVTSREALFALLRDKLGWPVNAEDAFTYPVDLERVMHLGSVQW